MSFMVDTEYKNNVALECLRTYATGSAFANSLRHYTYEDRLEYLKACVNHNKLQSLYNFDEDSSRFSLTKESNYFLDLFFLLHNSLKNDTFSKESLIQLRDQYLVPGEESFYFFPTVIAASLAFALHATNLGGWEKLEHCRLNFLTVVTKFFKINDKPFFGCLFDGLVWLFEYGYISKTFVEVLMQSYWECSPGFQQCLEYFRDNCHAPSFVYAPISTLSKFDLNYDEYVFSVSLLYILKSNSYNPGSQRPRKYLSELTQVEQVYLVDLFSVYCTLVQFSEHSYHLIYKAVGNHLDRLVNLEDELASCQSWNTI